MTSAAGRGDGRRLGRRPGRRVGRVEVRRLGRELGGARVDHRVAGLEAERVRAAADVRLPHPGQPGEVAVGEARPLGGREQSRAVRRRRRRPGGAPAARTSASRPTLRPISARNQGEMPVASRMVSWGTPRRSSPSTRHSRESDGSTNRRSTIGAAERWAKRVLSHASPRSSTQRITSVLVLARSVAARVHGGEVVERRLPRRVLAQRSGARLLQAPERLVQRRPEGPVDRHHLAGRLHLRPEAPVGGRELVEREARQLDDDVVERGLEGRDRRAGDDVGDVGERAAGGDLGRDARDRVARRLGRERRRARHARVDLDHRVLGRVGRQRELDVAAALDAERPDDRERRAAQPLVDLVGQRLDRRHDDRVARVDAQRVDVLHRAHGDARVLGVAHDLVLDLLPAHEAALDHHLLDRARPEARPDPLPVRVLGLDDPAARAAERERRPDDRGQADVRERRLGRDVAGVLVRALDDERRRVRLVDAVEQVAERLAVLGHADRLERRPEQPDVVALEDARPRRAPSPG